MSSFGNVFFKFCLTYYKAKDFLSPFKLASLCSLISWYYSVVDAYQFSNFLCFKVSTGFLKYFGKHNFSANIFLQKAILVICEGISCAGP